MLSRGEVDGVFQLDASPKMKQIIRELCPNCLEDISSAIALYRPGPLDAGLIPSYIKRKLGKGKFLVYVVVVMSTKRLDRESGIFASCFGAYFIQYLWHSHVSRTDHASCSSSCRLFYGTSRYS